MADENTVFSKDESDLAKRIAKIYGVTEEQAVELVTKKEIERRVRLRTGKGPAKVYGFKNRKK